MTTETRESQTPNTPEPFFFWLGLKMEPVGKGRPRFTRSGHAYTPARTRAAERQIAIAARSRMAGKPPASIPLRVSVTAVFPIPKSWPKAKREAAEAGTLAPTVKPDVDNIAKLVDALNGIVFEDDRQIVELSVLKAYGPEPSLSFVVQEWRP